MSMIINPHIHSNGAGVDTDPYWANVSLLLHNEGTNGGTTFIDSSSYNHTVTAVGSVTNTAVKKFGVSSQYNNNSQYLSVPAHASLGFGSGDFTIEMWVQHMNTGGDKILFESRISGAVGCGIYITSSPNYRLYYTNNSGILINAGGFPAAWTHVAVCRSGTTVRGFINGTLVGSATDSRTFASSAAIRIGSNSAAGQSMVGYIDDVRVTKGIARYTANFTPPTTTFPDS